MTSWGYIVLGLFAFFILLLSGVTLWWTYERSKTAHRYPTHLCLTFQYWLFVLLYITLLLRLMVVCVGLYLRNRFYVYDYDRETTMGFGYPVYHMDQMRVILRAFVVPAFLVILTFLMERCQFLNHSSRKGKSRRRKAPSAPPTRTLLFGLAFVLFAIGLFGSIALLMNEERRHTARQLVTTLQPYLYISYDPLYSGQYYALTAFYRNEPMSDIGEIVPAVVLLFAMFPASSSIANFAPRFPSINSRCRLVSAFLLMSGVMLAVGKCVPVAFVGMFAYLAEIILFSCLLVLDIQVEREQTLHAEDGAAGEHTSLLAPTKGDIPVSHGTFDSSTSTLSVKDDGYLSGHDHVVDEEQGASEPTRCLVM
eukprot:GILK01003209.1.p1 GENE.GILK01003209.1~~GILK01003209.1.p1  ORF type:complete len:366 (+),score=32.05 GILK01003209.1:76-1173(+)